MTQLDARDALLALAQEALAHIREAGDALDLYRKGTALFNPARDERFTVLPSFAAATAALEAMPLLQERYGQGESRRLVLQVLYSLFGALQDPAFDNNAFEAVWSSFLNELSDPDWTYAAVSNLANFRSESAFLDLGDGITIRGRSVEQLGPILGWSERHFGQLFLDWEHGTFGQHVLLVQHKVPKSPANFVLANDLTTYEKAQRALLAMRLLKPGDVRIGRFFFSRPTAFNVGLGGMTSSGFSVWHPGLEYRLEEAEIPNLRSLYNKLVSFETNHAQTWKNITIALHSFASIYDRYLNQAEDKVIDAITSIEAVLNIDSELSFRCAFRSTSILASNDDERVKFFEDMRTYYDTRSAIVHGDTLDAKQLNVVQNIEPLRDIVRRLLIAFLNLALQQYRPRREFYRTLDSTLQHSQLRGQLRKAAALE